MYLFNKNNNEITNLETLEIYQINESAGEVINSFLSGQAYSLNDFEAINTSLKENDIDLLQMQLWTENTFRLNTPIVHIVQNCNSPCIMCDCWKTKGRNVRTAEELYPVFEKFAEYGASSVMVSGGEPTLNPELSQIIDDIHHLGMGVELNTNGTLLAKRYFLYDKSIEALIVSIDGLSDKDYKAVRGLNKFTEVCQNIIEFKKKSPSTVVGIRVTLTKYTLTRLGELLELCHTLGIDSVGFSPLDVVSSSFSRDMSSARMRTLQNDLLPNEDDLEEILESFTDPESENYKIIDKASQSSLFAWNIEQFKECIDYYKTILKKGGIETSNEPCSFPDYSLVVDYDKGIKPCFYAKAYSDIYNFSKDKWDLKKIKEDLKKSGVCNGCRGKIFCG